MPVRKFRSIEELEAAERWYEPGSPELHRAMRALWEVAAKTSTRRFPPGVHRHRSIEEMDAVQEGWRRG